MVPLFHLTYLTTVRQAYLVRRICFCQDSTLLQCFANRYHQCRKVSSTKAHTHPTRTFIGTSSTKLIQLLSYLNFLPSCFSCVVGLVVAHNYNAFFFSSKLRSNETNSNCKRTCCLVRRRQLVVGAKSFVQSLPTISQSLVIAENFGEPPYKFMPALTHSTYATSAEYIKLPPVLQITTEQAQ